jgi:hypothetical protein
MNAMLNLGSNEAIFRVASFLARETAALRRWLSRVRE